MKTLYSMLLAVVIVASCKKLEVDSPSFDVTVDKATYKVGDTVRFTIYGDADNIAFYSGEPKNNYEFADRLQADGVPQLDFTTHLQNPGQANTLKLLVSTDYNGPQSLMTAKWTDITSKATLSTGNSNTNSGKINLSDFLAAGKPVYFAFRYLGYTHPTIRQPKWTIQTFNLNNILPDGSIHLINKIDEIGWSVISNKNPIVMWSAPTSGQAVIEGGLAGSEDNDDWLVSKAIDLKKVLPDNSVSIKNLSSTSITAHTFIYKTAGTYKVRFIGFNNSIDDTKSVIKDLTIKVTP